jgi:predicted dehydrogenase
MFRQPSGLRRNSRASIGIGICVPSRPVRIVRSRQEAAQRGTGDVAKQEPGSAGLPVYTAAVVGGGAGGKLNLAAFDASSRYRPVAACDIRPDVCRDLEARYPGLRTFTSHAEMFSACPTDVVCVATLPPSHEAITADALRLPLTGIVVEKPLGHTAASGRRVLEMVQGRGLPLAVPHGLLVKRAQEEIVQHVHEGAIGDLKLVEIQCRGWDIINAGIHWLNFFTVLTAGDPVEHVLAACDATTRTYRDGMQVETLAVTSAQTRSGVRVVMHTGDHTRVNAERDPTVFRLFGTAGSIECGAFSERSSGYRLINAQHPGGAEIAVEEEPRTRHQRHLENLARCMDEGRPDYAVAESSLAALEMCEAAYLSSRLRCSVSLPLDRFEAPAATDWDPGSPYGGQGGGRDGRRL